MVDIVFGRVVKIEDDLKIYRVKVKIFGLTDTLEVDDLPYYFKWYGINYLPELNDLVPVIIFDDNYATGFYGKKIVEVKDDDLSDSDYLTYLEIYKRIINDNPVSLTYTESNGFEFINGDGKIQVELDTISLLIGSNGITITEDLINLGTGGEASLLGDKTVQELKDIIAHQKNIYTQLINVLSAIGTAATPNPHTAPIGAIITSLIPSIQVALDTENQIITQSADTLQSEIVFIQ